MTRFRLLLAAMSFVAVTTAPGLAAADVNNFTITNFTADETLSRNDPQGELHIKERIDVVFTDNNHGLLRAIPSTYKSHSLQLKVNKISSDTGAPVVYTTYGSNGNAVLKIGDPNQTVTGAQQYSIDYTLRNVISFYNDHDELYWDVNGNQWMQQFQRVAVTVHLPAGLQQTKQPICYAGVYGSTAQECTISSSDSTLEAITTMPLASNQTLTYVAGFQKGYFQPHKWYETLSEQLKPILEAAIPILLIGGGSFIYWLRRGRDPKGTGIIIPQYEAPDGLKPAEVGTIIDFKLDNRDITATIIDLAIRGYLIITETKHDRLLRKDQLMYGLQLKNADYSKLDANETILMHALFSEQAVGADIDISVLKTKLYTTAQTLGKNVEASLTDNGYFHGNPLSAGSGLMVIVGVTIFLVFYASKYIGWPGSIGLLTGIIIAGICARFMAARTAKGVTAKEHILGLKMYLEVAEKDRIEKLQSPDAPYAANAAEPVKTVDLFEKLLPYAMVLGVEKQWAGKFESLYTSPPTWYSGGNWSTFNTFYLVSSLNDGIGSAVNSAFTAPSSSGSSGFGGGFSGGGGGGGGGGGW